MTELNMNLPERALEALGKERSALAAYKKQNAEQQRQITEMAKFIASIAFELDSKNFDRAVKIAKQHGIPLKGN